MKDDISEVFSETEETTETPEVEETATAEPETEEVEEEESTVDDGAATTAAEQDEAKPQELEDDWTKHAYLDEKRKRQVEERRVHELEDQLSKLQEPKEDDTDYLSPSELKKRVDAEVDTKLKQVIFQDRLQRSYEETASKYDDYPAMEELFVALAGKDANLKSQFESSINPTEFAYKHAKNHTLLNEYGGDVQKLIDAKLEEAKKEFGLKPEEPEKTEKPSRTPSLANATESEKNSSPPSQANNLSAMFEDSPY